MLYLNNCYDEQYCNDAAVFIYLGVNNVTLGDENV